MSFSHSTQIANFALIDAGLMELGGHHVCMVDRICEGMQSKKLDHFEVFAHKALHPSIEQQLIQSGVNVYRSFHTNFYQCFNEAGPLSKSDAYIAQLTEELVAVYSKLALQTNVVAFYPCASWQHLIAIAMAAKLVKKRIKSTECIVHVVCLMFNPGISFDGKSLNRQLQQSYQLALQWLAKHKNVHVVATDEEQQQAFQHVSSQRYALHPSYLENWQAIENSHKTKPQQDNCDKERVLVYIGQAKENKGFCQIPQFLSNNIQHDKQQNLTRNYVVQFTCAGWEDEKVNQAVIEIKAIASQYSCVKVYDQFLNEDQLKQEFLLANSMLFLYNAAEYQHKSSGVLWLASFYKLHVYVEMPSWITREALRLGNRYTQLDNGLLPEQSSLSHSNTPAEQKTQYSQAIYADFWVWLDKLYR